MPNEPNDLIQPEQMDEVIPLEELNPDLKTWPGEETSATPPPPPPSQPRKIEVELSVSELTKNGPIVISGPPLPKVTLCEGATVRPYPHNPSVPVNAPAQNEPNSPKIEPATPANPLNGNGQSPVYPVQKTDE